MFKCQLSGRNSIPGESPVRIVTRTRPKMYVNKKEVFENEKKTFIEVVTHGWEIVEEKLVLRETAEALNNGQEKNAQATGIPARRSETLKRREQTFKKV